MVAILKHLSVTKDLIRTLFFIDCSNLVTGSLMIQGSCLCAISMRLLTKTYSTVCAVRGIPVLQNELTHLCFC